MLAEWKESQVFKNNPQGSWLRGQKKGGGIVYRQMLRNAKLHIGMWLKK
jgi:hypothetical protein